VLDSGTTFTYLPSEAFLRFREAVTRYALAHGLHVTKGPDPKARARRRLRGACCHLHVCTCGRAGFQTVQVQLFGESLDACHCSCAHACWGRTYFPPVAARDWLWVVRMHASPAKQHLDAAPSQAAQTGGQPAAIARAVSGLVLWRGAKRGPRHVAGPGHGARLPGPGAAVCAGPRRLRLKHQGMVG
jgi:hypothetical protein